MRFLERLSFTIMAFGAIALFVCGLDAVKLMQPAVDLYDMDYDDMKDGMHVTCDVELVWDSIIQEVTYDDGKESESARYYVIPNPIDDPDPNLIEQFYAIKVSGKSSIEEFETILDDTNDWYFDETGNVDIGDHSFHIDGIVHKMDSEEESYMVGYINDFLYGCDEDADDYYTPFYVEPENKSVCYGGTLIGVALLAGGIFLLIFTNKKIKASENEILYRPTTNPNVQRDYYGSNNSNSMNTYPNNNMYSNANEPTFNNGTSTEMWSTDSQTGLSQDFLQRSAQEQQQKPVEQQYDMGSNPLYGTRPDGDNKTN